MDQEQGARERMNELPTCTESGTDLTRRCSLAVQAELTRVRGLVRRLPDGSTEQLQNSLLAELLEQGVSDRLKAQVARMSGAGRIAIEDSALADFPAIAEAMRQRAAYRQAQGE